LGETVLAGAGEVQGTGSVVASVDGTEAVTA
jgi:hypothetical protein